MMMALGKWLSVVVPWGLAGLLIGVYIEARSPQQKDAPIIIMGIVGLIVGLGIYAALSWLRDELRGPLP